MSSARLTVIGSGTLLPDGDRRSAGFHVDLGESGILLDAGPGTLHGLAELGVAWRLIDTIVITHFHGDHIGDLPALLAAMEFTGRERPLHLLGPVGFEGLLRRMADVYGSHVRSPDFGLHVVEMSPGEPFREGDVDITCCPTPHTAESIALRLEGPWGRLGYTGDTGPAIEVSRFLRTCAVLLVECALSDPPDLDTHLSPSRVAELAVDAEPDLLVVTHVYPPQIPAEAVARVGDGYGGPVIPAYDGLRVTITAGGPTVDPMTPPL